MKLNNFFKEYKIFLKVNKKYYNSRQGAKPRHALYCYTYFWKRPYPSLGQSLTLCHYYFEY